MGRVGAGGLAAVADTRFAKARRAAPAVGAAAAALGAFHDDAVAFFDAVDRCRFLAEFFDTAQNLMAEDKRVGQAVLAAVEIFEIGTADAAHFDFDQAAVGANVRDGIFPDFQFVRSK